MIRPNEVVGDIVVVGGNVFFMVSSNKLVNRKCPKVVVRGEGERGGKRGKE